MGHTPHLFLPRPWPQDAVPISPAIAHHLSRVLRIVPGEIVTYTDGAGVLGQGSLTDGFVERGVEQVVAAPRVSLTIAVAPPHDKDRVRFLVEKLAELEVKRTIFLKTRFGAGRIPDPIKAASWAAGALEQSRGSRLMEVGSGWIEIEQLTSDRESGTVLFADPTGSSSEEPGSGDLTIAVGPEGGWAAEELPPGAATVSFGRTVLRVETAAIVAAAWVRGSHSL